jgi:hypothetical protein
MLSPGSWTTRRRVCSGAVPLFFQLSTRKYNRKVLNVKTICGNSLCTSICHHWTWYKNIEVSVIMSSRTATLGSTRLWHELVPGIFLGVKGGQNVRLATQSVSRLTRKCGSGSLDLSQPYAPLRHTNTHTHTQTYIHFYIYIDIFLYTYDTVKAIPFKAFQVNHAMLWAQFLGSHHINCIANFSDVPTVYVFKAKQLPTLQTSTGRNKSIVNLSLKMI